MEKRRADQNLIGRTHLVAAIKLHDDPQATALPSEPFDPPLRGVVGGGLDRDPPTLDDEQHNDGVATRWQSPLDQEG